MTKKLEITILVENSSNNPELEVEHGLSYLIEYDGHKIMFDCGQSDKTVSNAKKLGIDLKDLDAIVFSHGHYDHTGGLPFVYSICPDAKVYLHSDAFKARFSKKEDGVNFIGMPRRTKRYLKAMVVDRTPKPTEIFPGINVTGAIPRMSDFEDVGGAFYLNEKCTRADKVQDDQSLYIETEKGIVVILGCSHSGVINTLDYIDRQTDYEKVHAVIGGMHLVNADESRIKRTTNIFKRRDIDIIVPLHCTGEAATEAFKENLADKVQIYATGDKIEI